MGRGSGEPGALPIEAYLINLPRRPERLARMLRVKPTCIDYIHVARFGTNFDGETLMPLDLAGYGYFPWQVDSDRPNWNRPLKLGEIGCAIAHHLCWTDCHETGKPYALILEDDVDFAQNFCARLAVALAALDQQFPDWDLYYLGRLAIEPDREQLGAFVVPGFSYCTHGYAISRAGAIKLLSTRFLRAILPVDELLPALYLDHPRADVRERYPKLLNAYAAAEPLVIQLPKEEAGSDTEGSPFLRH